MTDNLLIQSHYFLKHHMKDFLPQSSSHLFIASSLCAVILLGLHAPMHVLHFQSFLLTLPFFLNFIPKIPKIIINTIIPYGILTEAGALLLCFVYHYKIF